MLVLLVFGIYWVIRIAKNILEKASLLGGLNRRIYKIVNKIYIMAEPIGALIVLASFIMINPFIHGIIAIIVLLLGYNIIKSYFCGITLQMSSRFYEGQKIKVDEESGFIQDIGRTSIFLQTKQGAEQISYARLFENGYTKLQGERIGGLEIIRIESELEETISLQSIKDMLWESPYLDWSFDPEVHRTNSKNQFEVKLLLRERNHLEDLKHLINEWGYSCTLKK